MTSQVFELRNEHGIPRAERDRLVNMLEDHLIDKCQGERAKRIKVTVELEFKEPKP